MSNRVSLQIKLTLLSDTIFSSGFSVPGGEDIAVYQDEKGYPYFKGTSLKGVLRESLSNYLLWTNQDENILYELLGKEDWNGEAESRRLQFTNLTLKDKPQSSDTCFEMRTFTTIEDGITKEESLRMAMCVNKGLVFYGEIICDKEDETLIENALKNIKWVGLLRNRGFGNVEIKKTNNNTQANMDIIKNTKCIYYKLKTKLPIIITNLNNSSDNVYETWRHITGSAIRGMVMSTLAQSDKKWFEENKKTLLSNKIRFLNAINKNTTKPSLPTIKGFYEYKDETKLETVITNGTFEPQKKRAKLGDVCSINGDTINFWKVDTSSFTRIKINSDEKNQIFQTSFIEKGQIFEGYILLDDETLAEKITSAFTKNIWLGADRYEGFGKCEVLELKSVTDVNYIFEYSYQNENEITNTLYMLAMSPITMQNEIGEPCGINIEDLAVKLGVNNAKIEFCSTSTSEYSSYNRTWGTRSSANRMYDSGSIFKIVCDEVPTLEKIKEIQLKGLGIRTAEGFGQVLFIKNNVFENISKKEKVEPDKKDKTTKQLAEIRCAKYNWIMQNYEKVKKCGASNSQIGEVQTLCEKAKAKNNINEINLYFEKKVDGNNAKKASKFEGLKDLINNILEKPLCETLNIDYTFNKNSQLSEKLDLICSLFDYSRKNL